MMSNESRVAIIGGGIAGLSAARKLKENGIFATVFEQGRRVGGRVATQKHHGRQFDHGAQYLTPHSRRSAVLFSKWRKEGWITPWNAIALEMPERKKIDTSSWHVAIPTQASLPERLAQGIECRTKVVVTGVEGEIGARYLVTATGEREGPFEIVLCTCPAETSFTLLESFPELQSLAGQVPTRPCLATMVLFEEELMVEFEAAYISHSPLAWACRNACKPERPELECWVLHATEEWSREHLEERPEKVASMMLSAFAALSPMELPPVSYCRSHRWRTAYPDAPLGLPFCYDDQIKVGVAGDWCSAPNIDGAYWSGFDLASAVVRSLSKRR